MRILTVGNMYPPHHLGGYELMWRSAVGHLRERGHAVRVLTTDYVAPELDPSTPDDDEVFRELRWYWHEHDYPRLGPRARVRLERHNAAIFGRHVEEFRPDAINWWAMGGMSLSLLEQARTRAVPAAAVVVDDWILYGPRVDAWLRLARRLGPLRSGMERLAGVPASVDLEHAGHWLFASKTLRERAGENGLAFDGARIANPGIDHDLFVAGVDHSASWSWRLLYCGRIDERKGIDLAVEALAELPEAATLTCIGGGDEEHLLELGRLVSELGLASRVAFERRPRSELPAAYAEADVTLFPVRWAEPFGLVPLESMAVGTPVVASGRGGSGEYLEDGGNCLLFDPDRGAGALAAALRRLADDAALRARLRAGGLATADGFHEREFNRAVEAVIAEAVDAGGVSRPRPPAGS